MKYKVRLFFVALVLFVSALGAGSAMSAEKFCIRLSSGNTLFDETDVELYKAKRNTFVLTQKASQRLVSNWAAVSKDAENIRPEGTYFDAANKDSAFDLMLGDKKVASGIVASFMTLYLPHSTDVFLYGEMPLIERDHASFSVGKVIGDTKHYAEGSPELTFKTVLGADVAEHFGALKKLEN